MDPRYEATRLIDVARSLRLAARSAERERRPREQLARLQRERLQALVRHAVAHSPHHRRIGGGPVELASLPVLDDELSLGRYRAMATSGSSGRKGLYVYDRPGWVAIGASFMRLSAWSGTRPRLPRRPPARGGDGRHDLERALHARDGRRDRGRVRRDSADPLRGGAVRRARAPARGQAQIVVPEGRVAAPA